MNRVLANVPRLTAQLAVQSRRPLTSSCMKLSEEKGEPVDISHIKKWQEKFQIDDGVPVHLKAGLRDTALFGATALLCGVGLVYGGTIIYSLAMPPS